METRDSRTPRNRHVEGKLINTFQFIFYPSIFILLVHMFRLFLNWLRHLYGKLFIAVSDRCIYSFPHPFPLPPSRWIPPSASTII